MRARQLHAHRLQESHVGERRGPECGAYGFGPDVKHLALIFRPEFTMPNIPALWTTWSRMRSPATRAALAARRSTLPTAHLSWLSALRNRLTPLRPYVSTTSPPKPCVRRVGARRPRFHPRTHPRAALSVVSLPGERTHKRRSDRTPAYCTLHRLPAHSGGLRRPRARTPTGPLIA